MEVELRDEWRFDPGARAAKRMLEQSLKYGRPVPADSESAIIEFFRAMYNSDRANVSDLVKRIGDEQFEDLIEMMRFFRRTKIEAHRLFKSPNRKELLQLFFPGKEIPDFTDEEEY